MLEAKTDAGHRGGTWLCVCVTAAAARLGSEPRAGDQNTAWSVRMDAQTPQSLQKQKFIGF